MSELPTPPVFCKSIVPKALQAACFDRVLQVFILKGLWGWLPGTLQEGLLGSVAGPCAAAG
jgi:hypothetical protein